MFASSLEYLSVDDYLTIMKMHTVFICVYVYLLVYILVDLRVCIQFCIRSLLHFDAFLLNACFL